MPATGCQIARTAIRQMPRQIISRRNDDTVFQVASVSKAVTAWGVMRLVEKGQLDLDAPVEQYLTRWHLPPSSFDASGVTIRRLLSHSAGLSLHGYPGLSPDMALPSLEESLSGNNGGAGKVQIEMEPGTLFSYSGGRYTLLQLVIEEVTGKTFSDYMQRELLNPLGMRNSSFEWRAGLRPATAVAYSVSGSSLPNYLFTEQAAAGLYTTAPDLALFVAAETPGPAGEPGGRGVLKPDTLTRHRLVSGHQLVAQVIAVGDRCYACLGRELPGRAVPASREFAWLTS